MNKIVWAFFSVGFPDRIVKTLFFIIAADREKVKKKNVEHKPNG